MKKYILALYISLICFEVVAQQPRFIFSDPADSTNVAPNVSIADSVTQIKKDTLPSLPIYAWKIDPRFGQRIAIERDTTHYDFHTKSIIDDRDVSVGYLGNIGTPAQSRIYFNRPEKSQFYFLDAFNYYRKNPEDNYFINTKEPYSNIYYQTGGGSLTKEEHLKFELSTNFGKKINLGMHLDYLYARGFYDNLSNKQFNYDVYASYIDEKFELHGFVANNYFNNSENGGLTQRGDSLLGTTPSVPSKDLPESMSGVWNKLSGRHLLLTGKYNLGMQDETNVPIASAIFTTHYTDQKRVFLTKSPVIDESRYDEDWAENILSHFAYWSYKNTFAIALNEGFREWVKFGLKAFVEQDIRKYSIPKPKEGIIIPVVNNRREGQSETRIGGVLSKKQGYFLNYDLAADLAVTGYNLGEFNLVGDVSTSIPIRGKYATLKAKGYIKNIKPTFFENNYMSMLGDWSNDFSNTRKVYIGGELSIPHTGTILTGGVENVTNLIYVNAQKKISQQKSNIQVVAFGGEQKLKAGILHWDNKVVFQTSSDEDALPLPKLSVYSNVYIEAVLAKVLKVQLGFDARYYSKYYAPGYNPLTVQFYNQKEVEIGNFPITSAYANLHLKKTRFFLMMYNVTGGMGDSQYFSLPHYPVNPMTFKFGLSWDFDN